MNGLLSPANQQILRVAFTALWVGVAVFAWRNDYRFVAGVSAMMAGNVFAGAIGPNLGQAPFDLRKSKGTSGAAQKGMDPDAMYT